MTCRTLILVTAIALALGTGCGSKEEAAPAATGSAEGSSQAAKSGAESGAAKGDEGVSVKVDEGEVAVNAGDAKVRVTKDGIEAPGVKIGADGKIEIKAPGSRFPAGTAHSKVGGNKEQIDAIRKVARSVRRCVDGGCKEMCNEGESCMTTCSGGGCKVTCRGGSKCSSTCSGGGCTQICAKGAACNFNCSGGGCTQLCADAPACQRSCTGGACKE